MKSWYLLFGIAVFLALPPTLLPAPGCYCGLSISSERSYAPPPAEVDLPYYDVLFRHMENGPVELVAVFHQFSSTRPSRQILVSLNGLDWKPSPLKPADEPDLVPIEDMPQWDPNDSNFGLKFSESHLMLSEDHGRSWSPVQQDAVLQRPINLKGQAEALAALEARGLHSHFSTASWQKLIVFAIIFDLTNHQNVYIVSNQGVLKSCDRAKSWVLLNVGNQMLFSVHSLAINPTDSLNVAVGTKDGVYVSHNGGCTFERVLKIGQ